MKNKNVKYSIIAVSILIMVLILLYIFPNKSPFNNPESFWKACDKPVIGDAFHLSKEDNNFKNDTIFARQIPVGVVVNLENRFWAGDRILTVKSLKTGEVGTYCEK
jgi:hypothetical protein